MFKKPTSPQAEPAILTFSNSAPTLFPPLQAKLPFVGRMLHEAAPRTRLTLPSVLFKGFTN